MLLRARLPPTTEKISCALDAACETKLCAYFRQPIAHETGTAEIREILDRFLPNLCSALLFGP